MRGEVLFLAGMCLGNCNITVSGFAENMFIEGTLVTSIGSVGFSIILHGVK